MCDLLEERLISHDIEAANDFQEYNKWIKFWTEDCKITNAFYKSKQNNLVRRANITGSEYLIMLDKMYPKRLEGECIINYNLRKVDYQVNIFRHNDKKVRLDLNDSYNRDLINIFDKLFKRFYEIIIIIKDYKKKNRKPNIDLIPDNQNLSIEAFQDILFDWITLYDDYVNPINKDIDNNKIEKIIQIISNGTNRNQNKKEFEQLNEILSNNEINLLKSSRNKSNNITLFKKNLNQEKIIKINRIFDYSPITPYMHLLVFHIPEFMKIYGNINLFNTQGLEKLNDFTTQYYHTSTNKNKKNNKYLRQLIEKRNRIECYILGLNYDDFI